MGKRADLIARIAPVAPPCFETRMQWVAYLSSAAEGQRPGRWVDDPTAPVLVTDEAGTPRVNARFAYCKDCTQIHSHAMRVAGRCKPNHLIEQESAKAAQ